MHSVLPYNRFWLGLFLQYTVHSFSLRQACSSICPHCLSSQVITLAQCPSQRMMTLQKLLTPAPFSLSWQIFLDVSFIEVFLFFPPKPLSWPAHESHVNHMNSMMTQRQRELHLVLNVWLSILGWAGRSTGCDWYNFSPSKGSFGNCFHVPIL